MSLLLGLTQQQEGVLGKFALLPLTVYKTGVDYHGSNSYQYDVQWMLTELPLGYFWGPSMSRMIQDVRVS